MIITENISNKYGENIVIDRLSLKIDQREVFGFLGPKGAGKTSTVRVLTGLITPSQGHAEDFGIVG